MPDQSAHLTDFLKGQHQLRCFMSIFTGVLVLEAEILFAPIQNLILIFSVSSGNYLDVHPGFRVDIVTSDGRFKGRTRVSYGDVVTSTTVHLRETSPGSIDIQPGDLIRIYREVRLSDKLPAANSTFAPDFVPASVGAAPPPLACSGGAWAGWTRQLPALMTGSASSLVDPDSSTPPTHDWSETDGLTISSGTSTSADPQFTGAAGSYLPAHIVTDPDNGKSITQHVPVVIHDKAHPPYQVILSSLPNEEARGGSATVQMLDNVLLSEVPDGALAIFWKEETIAGTRQSFGAAAPGRSHILLVGIIRREQGAFDNTTGAESLTFDVISPLARLDELMGYSKVMLNNATPDAWNKLKSLTIWRGIVQIYLFYSNAIEAGYDLVKTASVVNYDYPGLFADTATPIQQMRKLADGIDCRMIEDRRGRFEVQMRPELQALTDRASRPVTLILTARSILKWQYTRQHWRTVNRLQCNGFIAGYSSNPVVFSEWVGSSPAEGNQTSTIEGLVASSQANLNERCGRRGASADGIYVDANGVLQMALDLELTLRGVFDVFDFYDELIEVQITTKKRGLDLSGQQFVLVGSTVDFANGSATTTLRLRTCTNGVAGSLYIPPTSPLADYTPVEQTPVAQPTPSTASLIPGETGVMPIRAIALAKVDAKIGLAVSLDTVAKTIAWSDISTGLTGVGIDYTSDPYNYARGFALMSTGLYRCDDVSGASPSWSLVANNAALFGNSSRVGLDVIASHLRRGWFAIVTGTNVIIVTTDYWATWTAVSINGLANDWQTTTLLGKGVSAWICGHDRDHLYALTPYSGDTGYAGLYKSTNGGLAWSLVAALDVGFAPLDTYYGDIRAQRLAIPYMRSSGAANKDDASLELWIEAAGDVHTGQVSRIQVSVDRGATWTVRYGAGFNASAGWMATPIPMTIFTNSSAVGWWSDEGQIYRTTDHLSTISAALVNMGGSGDVGLNGWPPSHNVAIVFASDGTNGGLKITADGGATWFGNAPPTFTASKVVYAELSLFPIIPPA